MSSPEKAELLHELGVEAVIDRKAEGYRFWSDEHTQDEAEWRRFGKQIRTLAGEDPDARREFWRWYVSEAFPAAYAVAE